MQTCGLLSGVSSFKKSPFWLWPKGAFTLVSQCPGLLQKAWIDLLCRQRKPAAGRAVCFYWADISRTISH